MIKSLHTLLALWAASLALLASAVLGKQPSASGDRLLVVHDAEHSPRASLSALDALLSARGYDLTFREAKSGAPALVEYDERNFDHLLLLSGGSKTLPSDLSPQRLVSFLREGGNVIFGLSSSTMTPALRDLAREFSLEYQDRGSALIDHFRSAPGDDGRHTSVLLGGASDDGRDARTGLFAGGLVSNNVVFAPETLHKVATKPLVVKDASAHQIGDVPLAFPLVLPPGSSFSAEPASVPASDADSGDDEDSASSPPKKADITTEPLAATSDALTGLGPFPPVLLGNGSTASGGGQGAVALDEGVSSLVSAFQLADNSARALWIGSSALFSDELLKDTASSNRAVAEDLLAWGLQEKGVLRIAGTHHTRVRAGAEDVRPAYEGEGREDDEGFGQGMRMYRVKDTVTYSLELEQFTSELGWSPAPRNLDIQVALHMIDPYITVPLHARPIDPAEEASPAGNLAAASTESKGSTTYTATFQLPDRHGVFSFVLLWRRAGWTYLQAKDTAPVRPFNHDEHPRFLSAAWPYVAGAWSTIGAFVLFVGVWVSLDWAKLGGAAAGKGAKKAKTA
ncbi:oligosaccharyl transferase glycoprotein complex, beta subunit [Tilletia horrida]|uniref:Dolichyl-diphosphooligosaccharide--protein glycosyltransferase subunit WBP1 n=1 Tax=Tilletia horrida TaxID=155126 RepID=A0AAN6JJZ3_9BASI|nr:oligosaccharyl transferase glycoprotein complex, beta subunit [Tilletia horrida]